MRSLLTQATSMTLRCHTSRASTSAAAQCRSFRIRARSGARRPRFSFREWTPRRRRSARSVPIGTAIRPLGCRLLRPHRRCERRADTGPGEDADDGEITGVDEDLEERGRVAVTEERTEERSCPGRIRQRRTRVPYALDEHSEEARFGELVRRMRDEAGGEDEKHDRRDAEEETEIDAHAERIDEEAERDGTAEADDGAEDRRLTRRGED